MVCPRLWISLWKNSVRLALVVVVVAVVAVLGSFYGYFRATTGVLIFAAICYWGFRAMASAVTSDPDPEPAEVAQYGLKYVCQMCGLELRVEVAARDKAPTHCGEPMTLVTSGGKPPLRPV